MLMIQLYANIYTNVLIVKCCHLGISLVRNTFIPQKAVVYFMCYVCIKNIEVGRSLYYIKILKNIWMFYSKSVLRYFKKNMHNIATSFIFGYIKIA